MEQKWHNRIELEVRDYELDIQGIVNNSVYQNYLEHARHKTIQALGLDFAALHEQGIDPVVARVEIDYRQSLRSLDVFEVRTRMDAQGKLRFVFTQEIVRLRDGAVMVQAKVTAAVLRNGRPGPSPEIEAALARAAALEAAQAGGTEGTGA